ncbi:hypothetical protein QFZ21_003024 [Microbacterium sp. W4I20]|nr:hypothetical protein [Microbacterium sp. W4I20]
MAATTSAGGGDGRAVDREGAAGEHHHDAAEEQHVDRDTPEVALDDRLLRLGSAGEVAEVQDERAVDRDPRGGPAEHLEPERTAAERLVVRPGDLEVGLHQHPHGEADEGGEDDGTGEGLVLADHLHAVADDDRLHDPQDEEGDPAERRQPEEGAVLQSSGTRDEGDHDDLQHLRGEVGLDAEPGDRDATTEESGDLGTVDAEADAAHHREGHAGLLAHEPGEGEQEEQEEGAEGEGAEDRPAAHAEREQADRPDVVAEAVHVVRPEREDAVRAPLPALAGRGSEVAVVQARADAGLNREDGRRCFVQPLGCAARDVDILFGGHRCLSWTALSVGR